MSDRAQISCDDFRFDGPLGSDGAVVSRLGPRHFRIELAPSPPIDRPRWVNRLQFEITRNAAGPAIRLDVARPSSPAYWFNEYHHSVSPDGKAWSPVLWEHGRKTTQDTLILPAWEHPRLILGHQTPASAESVTDELAALARHDHATLRQIGRSLEGRPICRLTITDPDSRVEPPDRWCHYVVNHHPGEGNAIWRIIGLLRWALSDDAAAFRKRSIVHAVVLASPDSPTHGWSRCNGQGLDMNRAYVPGGADASQQAHESFVCQHDFERLIIGDCPPTTAWFMHTWPGKVEPFVLPGPELAALGGVEAMRDALKASDTASLFKPFSLYGSDKAMASPTHWNNGPWVDHGLTSCLIEGSGSLIQQSQNLLAGKTLGRAIAAVYRGTRTAASTPYGVA